ncbi:sulfotransferase domain-containing protein [Nocardioides terrisoli]|uniref:sulfotransferase domain-containing protein n=1 Tax=Nocardioides terrisoli TaxID=3388267 RepID=UPI0037C9224C
MRRRFANSKNPFLRKGESVATRTLKRALQAVAPGTFQPLPAILVNSLPKSGTHLLTQVIEGLPSAGDWGEFFVSTPSLTMHEIPPRKMGPRLRRIAPGEVAKGHLFWEQEYAESLVGMNVVTYFVYRDLRDVVASEAYYLAEMNRYHRMHRVYSALSLEDRLMLSICGSDDLTRQGIFYPSINERFRRYAGWLDSPNTLAVRYEDLQGDRLETTIARVVEHYLRACDSTTRRQLEGDRLHRKCLDSIDPARSHTFRSGKRGGWRSEFNERHVRAFKAVAGDLLVELGYESDTEWVVAPG